MCCMAMGTRQLAAAGLLRGKTVAVDATMLEANAAMRSIVRRDTGESYQEFLSGLAQASGIATPTRADLARLDRKRKKKTSNQDWKYPGDPDAKIAKMKDGRAHLAHKAEHAVDLETGALVAVTLQDADQGDTTTIIETAIAAACASSLCSAAVIAVAHRLCRILFAMLRDGADFSATRVGVEEGDFERTTTYKYRLRPKPPGRLPAAG